MLCGWEEIKVALDNVFKYLDTIDLQPYLEKFKGNTVSDMMDALEEDYPYEDQYSVTLFDAIHESEFVDYLNKRYNLKIRETVVSYFYI